MQDYSKGGLVTSGEAITVTIECDECILGRDGKCRRRDNSHHMELPADRFWVCPLNDGEVPK